MERLDLAWLSAFLSDYNKAWRDAVNERVNTGQTVFTFVFKSGSYDYNESMKLFYPLALDLIHRSGERATVALDDLGTPIFTFSLSEE